MNPALLTRTPSAMPDIVVLDSCVFNKIFLLEDDRSDAIEFLDFARTSDLRLVAPSLFLYEVLAVAAPSPFGAEAALGLIREFQNAGFEITDLNDETVKQAIVIANSGHQKTGFPTFYDSSYHALALEIGGIFLTSDAKHLAKAASHGSVVLLRDWKARLNK
ncbi:MAG: type II toxin-antitoxin system VapC family toxin [Rhizobiaceae bacterium]